MTALNQVSAFVSSITAHPSNVRDAVNTPPLIRREAAATGTERRTFECVSCRQKTDIVVPA